MAAGEKVTWVSRIATIDGRLDRKLCAASPTGGEERSSACHDSVGVQELGAKPGRQVGKPIDVFTVSHGRRTRLAVARRKESAD